MRERKKLLIQSRIISAVQLNFKEDKKIFVENVKLCT